MPPFLQGPHCHQGPPFLHGGIGNRWLDPHSASYVNIQDPKQRRGFDSSTHVLPRKTIIIPLALTYSRPSPLPLFPSILGLGPEMLVGCGEQA